MAGTELAKTVAKPDAAVKEAVEKKEPEPVLVERTVITEGLMRDCIIKNMDQTDSSVIVGKDSIVLEDVAEMSLSFENIFCIDNIVGFKSLTKLQLDNNIIERIQGLDELVNLTWLDLSFNNISKIEGLDKLVNLTDLSLFNNHIERIENLDACVNLHVLSVGNNKISNLEDVRCLRQFKRLRLLNLKGNPVTTLDDYQNVVLAFLDNLKYLDYQLIDQSQISKARDKKMDQLVELEEQEKQRKIELKEEKKKAERSSQLTEANMDLALVLFDQMVYKADETYKKLKILPGLPELHEAYRERIQVILDDWEVNVLSTHKEKMDEKKMFMETRDRHTRENETECIEKISDFESLKKKVFARYDKALENQRAGIEGPPASSILQDFKEDVEELRGDLMDLEMMLVEQLTDSIDEFGDNWSRFLGFNSNRFAEVFGKLQVEVQWYVEALKEMVMKLLVDYTEYEINSESSITVDGLEAAAAAAAAAAADAEAKAAEKRERGFDDDEEGEGEEKEEEKPAGSIFENAELVKMMQDKDAVNALVSSSGENHTARIMSGEDEVREKEMRLGNKLLADIRADEQDRNRSRVTEIHTLIEKYLTCIKEKLDEETREEDEEAVVWGN